MTHLYTKLGLFAKVIINPKEPFYTEENFCLKFNIDSDSFPEISAYKWIYLMKESVWQS